MTATTTALDESAFSLNFHVLIEAGSCFRLSGLSFDLGYEHNYNLPGDQYFAPYARLYISTNGTDWVSAGDPLTPSVEDPAAFANRPGGAYFIQTGMAVDLASLQERIFTEGTVLYFRLALAEGASSSTDRRRILIGNILLRGFTEVQNTQHLVVYHNPEEFAGLPANGGLWAWGNELLAGFERWTYNPDPSGRRHLQEPFIGHACARSRDGGLTWTLEPAAPVISPSVLCSFESSRFALRLWKEEFFVSCDRAAEWQGPFSLPKAGGRPNFARSSYIVTGPDSALLLISTEATETHPARSYSARLTNGSNVEFLSWIGDDLFDHAHAPPAADPYSHSIMPSAVRIGADQYVCAVSQRIDNDRWSDIYESLDGGQTWNYISELEQGSDNPVSLVLLGGDTVAAVYGWSKPPCGLRAKISRNAGRTWSDEIILRNDGLNGDIGYARATLRSDGAVVILYHYSTAEHPEQHIAATIWRPAGAGIVKNTVVYHQPGEFSGWPANGGLWMWGDELLTGFERWTYNPSPAGRHHNQEPFIAYYYARSRDGGLTWSGEPKPPNRTPAGSYPFEDPDFAMRLWKDNYFRSNDRGAVWGGPIALPKVNGLPNYARSNYIVTGPDSALLFISTAAEGTNSARSYAARLSNGSTIEFLSWVGDDLFDHSHTLPAPGSYNHSIMPSAVRISDDHYVCAVRQRIGNDRWSDIYESLDGGQTWSYISELEQGSDNPISLVSLGDSTVAALYGWRLMPYGLRAKISYNAGHTWSAEMVLRDDGLNDDIGYTRAAVRGDGAVVILYYYSTATLPEQHIAATIWRPASARNLSDEDRRVHAFGLNTGMAPPFTSFTENGRFQLTFYAARAYATYTVETSADLLTWERLPLPGNVPGWISVTNKTAAPAGFMRLKAVFSP